MAFDSRQQDSRAVDGPSDVQRGHPTQPKRKSRRTSLVSKRLTGEEYAGAQDRGIVVHGNGDRHADASWCLAWVFTNTFGFMLGWASGRAWGLSLGGDFYDLGNPMAGRVLFVTVWVCVVWVTQWFTLLQLSRPRLRTNLKLLAGLFLMPVFSIPLQGLVEAAENGSLPGVLGRCGEGRRSAPGPGFDCGMLACPLLVPRTPSVSFD